MSVIAKAMELLSFFSVERPELGLSEIRAMAKRDKATTYRHLEALEDAGLLEQNPVTKAYRIGPAVLRLAHLRETATPRKSGVLAVLPGLADRTGETAHASILEGAQLRKLAANESSRHSTRVVMDDETYPLHATASGAAVLGFGGAELFNSAIRDMAAFTEFTPTNAKALEQIVAATRVSGFGVSAQGFERGVYGIAVPLFDQSGQVAGALSVASVASRMTPELQKTIQAELTSAARAITKSWGGSIPDALETLWASTLARATEPEPAE